MFVFRCPQNYTTRPTKKTGLSPFFWFRGSFNVFAWVSGSIYQEKPWPKLTFFSFLKTLCLRALGLWRMRRCFGYNRCT